MVPPISVAPMGSTAEDDDDDKANSAMYGSFDTGKRVVMMKGLFYVTLSAISTRFAQSKDPKGGGNNPMKEGAELSSSVMPAPTSLLPAYSRSPPPVLSPMKRERKREC